MGKFGQEEGEEGGPVHCYVFFWRRGDAGEVIFLSMCGSSVRTRERRVVQCTVTCIFWRRARLIEISLSRVGGHRWYFVDSVVEVREGGCGDVCGVCSFGREIIVCGREYFIEGVEYIVSGLEEGQVYFSSKSMVASTLFWVWRRNRGDFLSKL